MPMLLTSHIYQFSRLQGRGIWGANVFLLVGDTLTLIDTGFKGRSVHIIRELARLDYSPTDITSIIITHHHADHTGSLAMLKEVTKARVIAHPADAPYIDGSLPQPGPTNPEWLGNMLAPIHGLWATIPVAVDGLVIDGDELPILGGIKILHTPGHTPGSISLFLKKEGLVIVGDVLSRSTLGLSLPSKAFTIDLAQEIQSIRRLASLDFTFIGFGHGSALMRNARGAVSDFASRIESKYNDIT
jgi:glyoxylase-like metal-dependent hydrolase (beta-lactamase superfamily II)